MDINTGKKTEMGDILSASDAVRVDIYTVLDYVCSSF